MPQLPTKILLLSALLCACASGPKVDPNHAVSLEKTSAAELLRVGRDAAKRGDSVRAEQYLALAMEEGADARVVMPILLKACIRSSHLRAALNHAEPYLLANPEDDELRKLLATIHLGLGQIAQARRELGLLLQRNESNPDAHYLLGVIATREDIVVARKHFLQAIKYTESEGRRTEVRSRLSELDLREREARLLPPDAVQFNAVQANAAQFDTAQSDAARFKAVQVNAAQSNADQTNAAQSDAAQSKAVQVNAAQSNADQAHAAQSDAAQSKAGDGT